MTEAKLASLEEIKKVFIGMGIEFYISSVQNALVEIRFMVREAD